MAVNHRIVRVVVAFGVGVIFALGSYFWITDTDRGIRRSTEESVVLVARDLLRGYIAADDLDISDASARVRAAGKVYIFPTDSGWELSGHYRRLDESTWHAYLMSVDSDLNLISLSVQDSSIELARKAAADSRFSATK